MPNLDDLHRSRYALLRSFRRDGREVDTPIWFAADGTSLVFRTKIGPKTARLTRDPRVELRACDYRGRVIGSGSPVSGRATILSGSAAAAGNSALRRRYGWQYNVIPLLRIPGVNNVDSTLPWREKFRRVRDCDVWDGSAIVRIDL
jgi:PPOX class probable F420-dependent enzyme